MVCLLVVEGQALAETARKELCVQKYTAEHNCHFFSPISSKIAKYANEDLHATRASCLFLAYLEPLIRFPLGKPQEGYGALHATIAPPAVVAGTRCLLGSCSVNTSFAFSGWGSGTVVPPFGLISACWLPPSFLPSSCLLLS